MGEVPLYSNAGHTNAQSRSCMADWGRALVRMRLMPLLTRGTQERSFASRLLGPADPSVQALFERLKFTVRRHEFNKDSLSRCYGGSISYERGTPVHVVCPPPPCPPQASMSRLADESLAHDAIHVQRDACLLYYQHASHVQGYLARKKQRPPRTSNTYISTSLTRNSLPLGPYRRHMPGALWWSNGEGRFFMSEVPLCFDCRIKGNTHPDPTT